MVDDNSSEEKMKWNGRKRLADSKRRKSNVKQVCFNDDEWEQAQQKMNDFGMSFSDLARHAVLNYGDNVVMDDKRNVPIVNKELLVALNKLAVNTNQIARNLNDNRKVYSEQLGRNQNDLQSLLIKVIDILNS